MATVAEIPHEASTAANKIKNLDCKPSLGNSKADFNVQNLVDLFTKLNPAAKEFFPSSYSQNLDHRHQLQTGTNLLTKNLSSDKFPNNRRVLTPVFPFDLLNFFLFVAGFYL